MRDRRSLRAARRFPRLLPRDWVHRFLVGTPLFLCRSRARETVTVNDHPVAEKLSAPRRWYVLLVLTLVYALSIADRYVMSTLIEPIKADLKVSDSAIGFLTGVSLALFYVTAGLPLASLADRANRRTMIALALGAWSAMTALCGVAQNFWQLLLARIGVGVGEAGGTPPSTSLLSDYFPWRRRAFALSVYSIGASLGSMLGSSAGYASDAWGWRTAFLLLGIPGLAFAILIRFTVREPQRGQLDEGPAPLKAGLLATLRFTTRQPALLHTLIGASVYTLWAWGLMWCCSMPARQSARRCIPSAWRRRQAGPRSPRSV